MVRTMSDRFTSLIENDDFREEYFIAETQARLSSLVEDKGFSRAELARKLGVSRARVSQMFGDEAKNFTLRLLFKSFDALGEEPVVITRADYERLIDGCNDATGDSNVDTRVIADGLTASMLSRLLGESVASATIEHDRSHKGKVSASDWANFGSNVVPLREAACGR